MSYQYRASSGTFNFECLACGALVGDKERHDDWHSKLQLVAIQATA